MYSLVHETKDQRLHLPEHELEVFDVYVEYLYTGCLHISEKCRTSQNLRTSGQHPNTLSQLLLRRQSILC